jgi:hypothetical protein
LRLVFSTRSLFATFRLSIDIISKVRVDRILEIFDRRSVMKRHNVAIVNENVEAILLGERVEFILKVFTILDILLEAEDGPFLKVNRLTDNLAQNVCVVKGLLSTLGRSTSG